MADNQTVIGTPITGDDGILHAIPKLSVRHGLGVALCGVSCAATTHPWGNWTGPDFPCMRCARVLSR